MFRINLSMPNTHLIIAHPHLLVRTISERFLLAWAIFGVGLTNESHWLQPMLVLTIHRWLAPVSVDRLQVYQNNELLIQPCPCSSFESVSLIGMNCKFHRLKPQTHFLIRQPKFVLTTSQETKLVLASHAPNVLKETHGLWSGVAHNLYPWWFQN